jgi:hypothetical protein
VASLAEGDVKAVYAHADPRFAQAVPQEQLTHLIGGVRAQGLIGACIGDGALLEGPTVRLYIGDYHFLTGYLEIKLGFDTTNAVNFVLLTPHPALPNPKAGYVTKTRLRLPFDGQWWVFWGGETEAENYHVIAPDQRHAYDFCVWKDGGTHQGDGSKNSDYWAWGRRVVAPASATVVEAVDGIEDNTPGVMNPKAVAGNHVVLDFGDGEYALIAHLQHGSVAVHPGDRVKAGQMLGLCGNSGNTSEPHVHMHLQDRAKLFHGAVGLPLAFDDYLTDGVMTKRGTPTQGQFICAAQR